MDQIPGLSGGFGMDPPRQGEMNVGRDIIAELMAEKDSLDRSFVHCSRLLEAEIQRVQMGEPDNRDPNKKMSEKIYISFEEQKRYNLVGRLLGPKGLTLKRMQAETQTKMSILGRGSVRDKAKEDELRNSNDPTYSHLKDNLHVLVEAVGPHSDLKICAGLAEVRKMLIPPEPGQPDLIAGKYHDPNMPGFDGFPGGGPGGPPPRGPPLRGGGRGRGGGGGRGRGMGGSRGMGGGRGMNGRGGGGRGFISPGGGSRGGYRGGWMGDDRRPLSSSAPYHQGSYDQGYGGGRRSDSWRERGKEDTHMGPGGGYGDRISGGGGSYDYSHVMEDDQYYSSFSDNPPDRLPGGGNDWKSPRPGKRDYRHHPYQQSPY